MVSLVAVVGGNEVANARQLRDSGAVAVGGLDVLRAIGVRPSTLRDNWPFDAPPKTLVDWALLGRAVVAQQHGASWVRAAARVGVSKRRLNNIALRRLDCTLKGLDTWDVTWIERQFRAWLLDMVLDADAGEHPGSPWPKEPGTRSDTGRAG